MASSVVRIVDAVARLQYGLVTLAQWREVGLDDGALERWLACGRLQRFGPRVYRLAGAPRTWEQRQLAAVLCGGTGAVASRRAAAWLWGLLEAPPDMVEITVPMPRFPRIAWAVVHRSSDLTPSVVTRRRGIAVTNPLRTLVDLGAVLSSYAVEDALDRGLVQRRFSVEAVERARAVVAKPGRDGSGVLRRVLDRRALEEDAPDSLLEPRMARLLRAADLGAAVFQHEVWADGVLIGRVDFAYPDVRLAIEVDGWESRATPAAMQRDLDRQNALIAADWTVLRFTWADVVRRPHHVAKAIRRCLRALPSA